MPRITEWLKALFVMEIKVEVAPEPEPTPQPKVVVPAEPESAWTYMSRNRNEAAEYRRKHNMEPLDGLVPGFFGVFQALFLSEITAAELRKYLDKHTYLSVANLQYLCTMGNGAQEVLVRAWQAYHWAKAMEVQRQPPNKLVLHWGPANELGYRPLTVDLQRQPSVVNPFCSTQYWVDMAAETKLAKARCRLEGINRKLYHRALHKRNVSSLAFACLHNLPVTTDLMHDPAKEIWICTNISKFDSETRGKITDALHQLNQYAILKRMRK